MRPSRPAHSAVLLLAGALLHALPGRAAAPERVTVPAGTSSQGSATLPDAPPRTVHLPAFQIAREEASIAAYEAFVAAGGFDDRSLWSEEGWAWRQAHPGGAGPALRASDRPPDHPVVAVTYWEAEAYCASVGGRLPTEAEWERAACGDGDRRFPWGEEEDRPARWYDGGKGGHLDSVDTAPVAEDDPATRGPFGLRHAAGNVWEWTADRYHSRAWEAGSEATAPRGPDTGPWRTLRGGSYMNLPSYGTCAHREPARPDRVALTTGIRCAWDVAPAGEAP